MNLIDIEDRLKDLSDQQLMQQMQRPDGTAPQFLVMSELKRRKEMRSNAPAPDSSTVRDDLVQQGVGSVAPQQQLMPQGDGIPRYNNGMFPGTNIPVRRTLQDYIKSAQEARQNISGAISGGRPIFDTSSRGPSVTGTSLGLVPNKSGLGIIPSESGQGRTAIANFFSKFGGNGQSTPRSESISKQGLTSRAAIARGGDLSSPSTDVNELGPVAYRRKETEAERLERMRAAAGDIYNDMGAPLHSGREGPVFSLQPLTPANLTAAGNMPTEGLARAASVAGVPAANVTGNANTPPSNQNYDYLYDYVPPSLGRMDSPSPTSSAFDGESTGATDYQRAVNQIMSAPSSSTPAEPPKNFYEDYEKKLKALYGVEDSGADAGMALLRAGLGMAQAGGEGKSTAAALGAGGIAGLDAYQASKKARDDRALKLLGVEGQLAGAKTQQAYNQQKLALDARMRDNQDKMLQLKGLGMSMEDDRIRALAATQNRLKFMQLQLQENKINIDANFADRKLGQLAKDGKIKGDYYEALIRKADRGDSLDRYINASPEIRQLILPILRKNNASLQDDIGKTAGEFMLDMGWVNDTKDALRTQLKREPSINDVIRVARQNAMSLYGQGGGAAQAPRDRVGIRG